MDEGDGEGRSSSERLMKKKIKREFSLLKYNFVNYYCTLYIWISNKAFIKRSNLSMLFSFSRREETLYLLLNANAFSFHSYETIGMLCRSEFHRTRSTSYSPESWEEDFHMKTSFLPFRCIFVTEENLDILHQLLRSLFHLVA